MINLIPPFAKKAITVEYYTRAVIVTCFLLTTAGIIIALLSLPTFVLVQLQDSAVSTSYEAIAEDSLSFEDAKKTITAVNTRSTYLDEVFSTEPMLPLVTDIQVIAGGQLVVRDIRVVRADDRTLSSIVVSGEAATREALANFRDALQNDPRFIDVELPLANLAKNEEVPFSINIGYQKSE